MNEQIRVLRIREIEKITSLKRSTIYKRLISDPTFPKPIKLSDSKSRGAPIGFIEHEIEEWIKSRIDLRNSQAGEN